MQFEWDEDKARINQQKHGVTFDEASIKDYIEKNLSFKIGDYVETATITKVAQEAIDNSGGNGYAISVLVSDDGVDWVEYLSPVVAKLYAISEIYIGEES